MPYVAFMLKQQAGALRTLADAATFAIGLGDEKSTAIPLAILKEQAGI